MSYTRKLTSAKPITVSGVTFRCYSVGKMLTRWDADGFSLSVGDWYFRTTYWATVNDSYIGKRYRTLTGAMCAAVAALP